MTCATCSGPLYGCDTGFTTCVECERRAILGKDYALAAVDASTPTTQREHIEAAILAVARKGQPFSANEVRSRLDGVPGQRIGPRFAALAKRGLIRHVGYQPSTKGNTHGHDVKVWQATERLTARAAA